VADERSLCCSSRGPRRPAARQEETEGEGERRSEESALFMAILILKWYLMSHRQIHRQIYPRGAERTPVPPSSPSLVPGWRERERERERLAIVVRIHTCVLVRPCCRCQRHSYRTRSTNDGVELPDGTPRGVRDLYPVWLPRVPRALPAPSRSRASLIAESPSSPLRPFLACGSRRNCRDALRQADARIQTTASVLLARLRQGRRRERSETDALLSF